MALDQKYVVFKVEEFEEEVRRLGPDARFLRQMALDPDSHFVIRRGDIFASGGLHGYATNIMSTMSNLALLCPDALDEDQQQNYMSLSFDVADLSRKWETEPKKLPD